MSDEFTPRLDILPDAQRRLWEELADVPSEFVLYGGTAVALHLGHRQSVDFDFFGNRLFDPAKLTASIPLMTGAAITQREPNTLGGIVEHLWGTPHALIHALIEFSLSWLRRCRRGGLTGCGVKHSITR